MSRRRALAIDAALVAHVGFAVPLSLTVLLSFTVLACTPSTVPDDAAIREPDADELTAAPSIVRSPMIRGVPYPVTWIPGTTEILVASSIRESLYRADATSPTQSRRASCSPTAPSSSRPR